MTDIEINRLCAEAMGIACYEIKDALPRLQIAHVGEGQYDPLRNDAQAMALVKTLGLDIHCRADMNGWYVGRDCSHKGRIINADLNRAICECAAKMQAAK